MSSYITIYFFLCYFLSDGAGLGLALERISVISYSPLLLVIWEKTYLQLPHDAINRSRVIELYMVYIDYG